ncbi:hypothetical protein BH23GEM3_BH23GEM3_10560 [soil metagenome]
MTLTIELPQELERKLAAEAERLGLPLSEYALRLLTTRRSGSAEETHRSGAELVALWRSEGVIGARPEIPDAQAHARRIRQAAERRLRA